jgi:hypothetical protein
MNSLLVIALKIKGITLGPFVVEKERRGEENRKRGQHR